MLGIQCLIPAQAEKRGVVPGVMLGSVVCDAGAGAVSRVQEHGNLFAERSCCRGQSHFLRVGHSEFTESWSCLDWKGR